jgi:hypothetical protein
MKRPDVPPRLYGYRIDRGVLFEYELNEDANLVTDPVTGARFRFNPTTFFRAALAGDFNGWTQISMRQNSRVPYQFQLLLPFEQFPERLHQFKFVIDGNLWVEPHHTRRIRWTLGSVTMPRTWSCTWTKPASYSPIPVPAPASSGLGTGSPARCTILSSVSLRESSGSCSVTNHDRAPCRRHRVDPRPGRRGILLLIRQQPVWMRLPRLQAGCCVFQHERLVLQRRV